MDFRDIKEFLKDASKYIITIIVILIIALYVVSFTQVIGPSMQPTLKENNVLILNKIHYKLFEVKRNDIIQLEHEGTKYLIKRVIGLPGETIKYENNILYINGESFKETIVDGLETDDFKEIIIPENSYFVLGDNREDSLDSRNFGVIKKNDIIGKCIIQIWPLNNFKYIG